jgi:ribosomal protein S18 acetylase RimI-like enzyme
VSDLVYRNLTVDLAEQCADLELRAFPTADPLELLSADDIAAYAATFPEGFFVCIDGTTVVGQGAGILMDFNFDSYQHSIVDITGEHQCGNHDPDGEWYYGTDIAVDPDYRRRGIGSFLYGLRKKLGVCGIVAGGSMPGFAHHKKDMTAAEYVDAIRSRTLYDPTLTFQLDQGFELVGTIENYLSDEATGGWSVLIVWRNPDRARRVR